MDEKDDSELLLDASAMGIKLWKKVAKLAGENRLLRKQAEKLREELVASLATPEPAPTQMSAREWVEKHPEMYPPGFLAEMWPKLPPVVTVLGSPPKKPAESATPGDGWRWLETGELLEEGDEREVFAGIWQPTDCTGMALTEHAQHSYRRRVTEPAPEEAPAVSTPKPDPGEKWRLKVDPGEGWRLLEVGETVQDGDYRKYNPFTDVWVPCDMSIGAKVTYERIADGDLFRRRVTEPTPVETPAEVKPEADPAESAEIKPSDVLSCYRLLEAKEVTSPTDEWRDSVNEKWRLTERGGQTVSVDDETCGRFRRRLSPAQQVSAIERALEARDLQIKQLQKENEDLKRLHEQDELASVMLRKDWLKLKLQMMKLSR